MCLATEYMKWWRYVNIKGCDTQGVAITHLCDECLKMAFHKLDEWGNNNLNIRIDKKYVKKYADIFNVRGWHIDPRDWSYLHPWRVCWYASVESSIYISPKIYD